MGKLGGGSGATLLDPDDARGGAGGGTTGDETSERGMLEEVTGKLTQVMVSPKILNSLFSFLLMKN